MTKRVLKRYWRNDGYAFWFKMLELLCSEDGHSLDLSGSDKWEDFLAYTDVTNQMATDILNKLAEIEKIDSDLWTKDKVVWCITLLDNLKPVYGKRTDNLPEKPILKEFSERKPPESGVSGVHNPQSIVKDSIGEETIGDIPPFIPPQAGDTPQPPPEDKSEKKTAYGTEFQLVRLTNSEYMKLLERLGMGMATEYIDRLDGWLAEGHRKKSHYATILNWWRKDYPKEASKGGGNSAGTGKPEFKPSRQ